MLRKFSEVEKFMHVLNEKLDSELLELKRTKEVIDSKIKELEEFHIYAQKLGKEIKSEEIQKQINDLVEHSMSS